MPDFLDDLPPHAAALLMDTLFEAKGISFALVDGDLRYLHVSETLAQKSNLPAHQHVGALVSDLMEPEKWGQTRPHLETALGGQSVYNQPHGGGEPSPTPHARASFIPVRLPDVKPAAAFLVEDHSLLHQAQMALREAHEKEAAARAVLAQEELRRYEFMRDVLLSVTDGRFFLCRDKSDLPPHREPFQKRGPLPLTKAGGVRELRKRAEAAARVLGMAETDWFDMETAVGEAAMNTVVHANGGEGGVYVSGTDTVQVWITDGGSGIPMEHLPRVALQKGFTTAGTMGCGFAMMLQTCDRLWLLTGTNGTTVVLEKDKEPTAPPLRAGNALV